MQNDRNRVAVVTTTTGTGTLTCGSAVTGHQAFVTAYGAGGNTEVYYGVVKEDTGEWEVGLGTFLGATNLLQRDTVLASSAGGSKVIFPAGNKIAYVTRPAETTLGLRARRPVDPVLVLLVAPGQTADLLEGYNSAGIKALAISAAGSPSFTGVVETKTDGTSGFRIMNAAGAVERSFYYVDATTQDVHIRAAGAGAAALILRAATGNVVPGNGQFAGNGSGLTNLASGQVGLATAALGYQSIGQYGFMRVVTLSVVSPGDTVAGSGLRWSNALGTSGGSAASGTWMCVGRAGSTSNQDSTTLFVRVA